MNKFDNSRREQLPLFSRLLAEKRAEARLTLAELSELTRLPLLLLENLESGGQVTASFDVCYKIAQALNSRGQRGFVIHDLWQAATLSRRQVGPSAPPVPRAVQPVERALKVA
jgi:transcriptional regulator with XRE-family HTH domain